MHDDVSVENDDTHFVLKKYYTSCLRKLVYRQKGFPGESWQDICFFLLSAVNPANQSLHT